jgi:TRAP-type mannitol/chloroaromatic compound transport system permease large subunit
MVLQAAVVLLIIFFLTLAYKVPVSFSIITSALVTIIMFLSPKFGMFISAQKLVTGIDSFSLLAVPFFILAGQLMSSGGIAKRLINLAMLVLGRVPGSLALANIAGNAMFGSLSGSGIAAATAIGGVMNPMEKEQGYDEGFSAATNIVSAPVGQLIPPTNAPIVYSAAAGGVSVATLLMAGWIPGLIWAAVCMIVVFIYASKKGYVVKRTEKITAKEVFKTLWDAIPYRYHNRRYPFRIFHTYGSIGYRGNIRVHTFRMCLQNYQAQGHKERFCKRRSNDYNNHAYHRRVIGTLVRAFVHGTSAGDQLRSSCRIG